MHAVLGTVALINDVFGKQLAFHILNANSTSRFQISSMLARAAHRRGLLVCAMTLDVLTAPHIVHFEASAPEIRRVVPSAHAEESLLVHATGVFGHRGSAWL